MPTTAEASIFSFISNLFSSSEVSAEEVEQNSQNLVLLQAVNSPDPKATSTDEEIIIVDDNSLYSETAIPTDGKNLDNDQISIYVVHQGDTLPAIAKMFGVTVNTIKWANDLTSNTVKAGQTLVILPISGIQHEVKKGDTLQSIAKLHKGDLDEIIQYNNLSKDDKLAIGDTVFVPDGEAIVVVSKPSSKNKVGASTPSYSGYYMRPIIGGVKTQGVHGHNGVDLASYRGANILASADGQVLIARTSGYNGGYGLYVVIKHANGTQTLYGHLSSVLVKAGEYVTQGQVIGKMGNTGKSTGTHLHFEIRGARNPF
jgi:LysM repeat protein